MIMINHIDIFLSLAYLIGTIFHLLMRADLAYKSKVNKIPNRRCWFANYWVSILVRVCFWGYGIFRLWIAHPEWPSKVAMAFGVPDYIANWLIITPTLGASVGAGFFIDVVLDYAQVFVGLLTKKFPMFGVIAKIIQAQVPQYDPDVVDVTKVEEEDKR